MTEFDDLLKDFLVESYENLDRLDQDFVILEQDPGNRDRLGSIFRTIHTIKGSCGFFGYGKLERVTHAGESLLSLLRDGQLALTEEITSALLALVDAVRTALRNIETTGQEGEEEYQALIDRLTQLKTPQPAGQPTGAQPASVAEPSVEEMPEPEPEPVMQPQAVPVPEVAAVAATPPAASISEAVAPAARPAPVAATPAVAEESLERPGKSSAGDTTASVGESNIRVDVGLLDKLMNLVGELVLARNQILQFAQSQKEAAFLGTTQRLNLITTELQEHVMKTRMQPIDNVWKKFPRVVRDLSVSCGKLVRLEMIGKETELDKTLIEAIKDPLTHLIRNSIDHGIETPEVRQKAGKSAEGRLLLRAFHEGGQVNIEISDDGAGIDVERVKQKALEKGLISADQARRLSERELLQLIFLPGFSTASTVTNLSGRGVGMDVVKTNIEKIGGTVDIRTERGLGTQIKIKIPLTLAIIPALIVTSQGDRYAIPQGSLLELVRLESEEARKGIERIHGAPVYRLRGQLLPIVYLSQQLGLTNGEATASDQRCRDIPSIKQAHLAFRQRIEDYLTGRIVLTERDSVSPNDCALGKWLQAGGKAAFGHLALMPRLIQAHERLHENFLGAITAKQKNDAAGVKECSKQVEQLSGEVVELLGRIEQHAQEEQTVSIVVLQAGDRRFGLVVDSILDTEEIVVKPLGKQLKGLSVFAGATIMGDGRVALILDVLGVAQKSGVINELRERALAAAQKQTATAATTSQTLLLLGLGGNTRVAIPLSQVARLEEIASSSVEMADGREVVQYRDEILPLMRLGDHLGHPSTGDSEQLQVIVSKQFGRNIGLVVDRILDIVEAPTQLQQGRTAHRPGVLGSVVIQQRVTDLLDIPQLISMAMPEFLEAAGVA